MLFISKKNLFIALIILSISFYFIIFFNKIKNKKIKRMLIYVNNNEYINNVSSYIFHQINDINHLFSNILIISNSELKKKYNHKLININNKITIIYEKEIYSKYYAWYKAIEIFGILNLLKYEEITFMTDESFGPIWQLDDYFLKFGKLEKVDFWGIISFKNTEILDYFITFKNNIIKNKIFYDFWKNKKIFTNKKNINITKYFTNNNFNFKTIHNLNNFGDDEKINILIKKIPFYRFSDINFSSISSFFLMERIYKYSNYPIDNIIFHISKFINPNNINFLPFKYLKNIKLKNTFIFKKIAIHLHIFYPELLKDFIYYFHQNIKYKFDLYITTTSEEKKKIITKKLNQYKLLIKFNFNFFIIITLNKGRDIYPMVQIKNYLSNYDYIGHFHDKKTPINYYFLDSWTRDLMYMMINCTNNIISNFLEYDELGIVIADIPSLFRYKKLNKNYNKNLFVFIDKIWNDLKIKKKLNNDNKSFVFSYGTFLWFKFDALRPFFNISEKHIPNEPLGKLTKLHLIERLFVYIAWSQNYDFKISSNLIQIPAYLDL